MSTTSTEVREPGARISTVSTTLGIPIPTIRSWERRYGFPTPERTDGRHRRYTPAEIAQLRAVRDRITRGDRVHAAIRMVLEHGEGLVPTGGALDAFAEAASEIDPSAVQRVLRDAETALGPERTITEIALPGMRMIGLRWRAGEIDVATEHAATGAVRGWLASLAIAAPAPARGPILLACAPGEHHTLGLEAFGVLLARRGIATRLLGANTPESALASAVRTTRARAIVLTAHRNVVRRAAIAAINAIDRLSGVRVQYAGNAFTSTTARTGVPGVYLGDDLLVAASIAETTIR
jgi:DNA-binding transcriptional MerR regulator